ncbi:MAG TPA: ParB/RepB/Spo0J family partition protein [Woeseiaceae bacterium]|nr:ParB/RepB/Spo0J family partition protein [Woeseiaceae bacterium]
MRKHKRLGRGLDVLLDARQRYTAEADRPSGANPVEVSLDELVPGRYQPRRQVPEESLAELADSIREQGVLQPLVVRPSGNGADGTRYEIVAGERRWRAAGMAGLASVPVVIRELDDQSALAVALIENLQREDLNPLDQARSLARLASEFELTHEQVAKAVGRSRASVSNLLRLLELQDDVKDLLATEAIDMGHARALLPLDAERQVKMARKAAEHGLSVRQVEDRVRRLLADTPDSGEKRPESDLQTRWLQDQIGKELGRTLSIRPGRDGSYRLNLSFGDLPQLQQSLQRVLELIERVRDTAGPRVRDSGH